MFPDLTTYKTNPSVFSLRSQKLKALLPLQTCPSLNHSEIFSFLFLSSLPLKFLFCSHTHSGTGGGTFFFSQYDASVLHTMYPQRRPWARLPPLTIEMKLTTSTKQPNVPGGGWEPVHRNSPLWTVTPHRGNACWRLLMRITSGRAVHLVVVCNHPSGNRRRDCHGDVWKQKRPASPLPTLHAAAVNSQAAGETEPPPPITANCIHAETGRVTTGAPCGWWLTSWGCQPAEQGSHRGEWECRTVGHPTLGEGLLALFKRSSSLHIPQSGWAGWW